MKKPFISIVIPTRNRANLLQYAIQSALDQSFTDYEILVSNNNCSDDTDEVVEKFQTNRVRYIRTNKTLSMPDHWEFALSHTTGEYVTYLCDDDAFCPNLLERAVTEMATTKCKLLTWNFGRYTHPSWHVPEDRNKLSLQKPFTGKAAIWHSHFDLQNLFTFKLHISQDRHPRMLNSLCARSVLEQIKQLAGRVFLPPCPDYTVCAAMLALTEHYIFLDEPLAIFGAAEESIGASQLYGLGSSSQQFLKEFGEGDMLSRLPLKLPVVANLVAASLLNVKERMAEEISDIELGWSEYFITCYEQILFMAKYGNVDISEYESEFFKILDCQPEALQMDVRRQIEKLTNQVPPQRRGLSGQLRRVARDMINWIPALSSLESRIRNKDNNAQDDKNGSAGIQQQWPLVLTGEEHGFTNIFQCTKQLGSIIETIQTSHFITI